MTCLCGIFFFFKEKTAYEVRISDWSSDVCSSDLACATTRWSRSAAVRSVTPCSRSSASAARLNTASATSISIKVKPFSAERLQKVKPFSAERRQEGKPRSLIDRHLAVDGDAHRGARIVTHQRHGKRSDRRDGRVEDRKSTRLNSRP